MQAMRRPGHRLRSIIKDRTHVFYQQEKMVLICGHRLEVEALVSGARFVVLGMHEQCVLERCLAQPFSLFGSVDGKTGQEHHENRMTGESLAHAYGRLGLLDVTDRDAVTANDALFSARDESFPTSISVHVEVGTPL